MNLWMSHILQNLQQIANTLELIFFAIVGYAVLRCIMLLKGG